MQNDTLFGQRVLQVVFEDGREAELTIKQFRLREYQAALQLIEDEIGLVTLACGGKRGVVEALHPKSFELAYAALKEVNAEGFFTWSERQLARGAANMRNLPPEMVERMLAKFVPSAKPLPGSPPSAA
jgi:hypothetical protein